METSIGIKNSSEWIYPGAINYPYGSFAYNSSQPAGNHPFSDGIWMKMFNTGGNPKSSTSYFVYWVNPTSGNPGHWSEDVFGYVGQALNKPPY
jgi:hypothetical protein